MRFSLSQLLLFSALCALLVNLAAAPWWQAQPKCPAHLDLSPDGRYLVAESSKAGLHIWDLAHRRPRQLATALHAQQEWFAKIPLGANPLSANLRLVNASTMALLRDRERQRELVLWDLSEDRQVHALPRPNCHFAFAVSPGMRQALALASPGADVQWWSLESGESLGTLPRGTFGLEAEDEIVGLGFSPQRRPLIVTRTRGGEAAVWEATPAGPQRRLGLTNPSGIHPRLSPDGATLACACVSDAKRLTIELWDIASQRRLAAIHGWRPLHSLAATAGFSPDGGHYYFVDQHRRLLVWSAPFKQPAKQVQLPLDCALDQVAVAADGRTAAVLSCGAIEIWDVHEQESAGVLHCGEPPESIYWHGAGFAIWGFFWLWLKRRRKAASYPTPAG